jgi:hypothetical protein
MESAPCEAFGDISISTKICWVDYKILDILKYFSVSSFNPHIRLLILT